MDWKHSVDITFVSLSLLTWMSIGFYFHYKQRDHTSISEFVFGRKKLPLLPIALTIATCMYVTDYYYDMINLAYSTGFNSLYYLCAYVGGAYLSIYVFSPVLYNSKHDSVFQYLGKRFGTLTCKVACLYYTICTIIEMSISMNDLCEMTRRITGISTVITAIPTIAISLFLFHMGGVKGIIWASTFHTIVQYITVVLLIAKATVDIGGLSYVWDAAVRGERTSNAQFGISLTEENFWSKLFSETLIVIYMYGISQVQIQLAFCCDSFKKYRMSLIIADIVDVTLMAALLMCGIVMYASVGMCDTVPNASSLKPDDVELQLLPFFILKHSSDYSGIAGISVVAIALSTLTCYSALLYALSYTNLHDVIIPIFTEHIGEARRMFMIKFLADFYGGIILFCTFSIANIPGIRTALNLVIEGFVATYVAIFTLGMIFRRPNEKSLLAAVVIGNMFVYFIAIGKTITEKKEVFPIPDCPQVPANTSFFVLNHELQNLKWLNEVEKRSYEINSHKSTKSENQKRIYKRNLSNLSTADQETEYIFPLFQMTNEWMSIIDYFLIVSLGYFLTFLTFLTGQQKHVSPELLSPLTRLWSKKTST